MTAIASAAGSSAVELVVVQPPGEVHAVADPRRRVARRRPASRNAASCGSSRPSSARVARAASRSPASSCADERLQPGPERAEADDHQPRPRLAREHEREGRQQQLHALGGDQLADEDDQPVAGLDASSAATASRGSRANEEPSVGAVAGQALPQAASDRAGPGVKRATSTPGGPSRVRRPPARDRPSRPTGSPPCAGSRRAGRRARSGPRPRTGGSAGTGSTVNSSVAAVDLDRVRDVVPERAREDQPAPSRGGSPARRPAAPARPPRAPPPRWRSR